MTIAMLMPPNKSSIKYTTKKYTTMLAQTNRMGDIVDLSLQ